MSVNGDPNVAGATTEHGTSANRPITSKPRGICKYYKIDRGCYAGDRCKFLHGESERLTPYDKSKVCRFYGEGYCRRGEQCWFLHADPSQAKATSEPDEDADEHLCSICYDKPITFGLLAGCSHVFCISCIKNWRESEGKSVDIIQAGTTKTCPMCRTSSRFVTPSTFFYAEGHPMKTLVIEKYKASMARVKCKYFEKSRPHNRFCPFGKECFYKHENADGTLFVFEHGAAYYMERTRSRLFRSGVMSDVWSIDMEEHVESMLNTISQVFGTSGEMQRAILESVAAEFGIDSLPPMYRLESMEEGHGDEERLSEPPARDDEGPETDAALIDTSSTSQVEQSSTGEESMSLSTHSQSPVDQLEGTASDAIFPAMESADTAHRSTAWSILDPTVPEFTPSFPRNNPRSDPGPSYELDWLRPLHPGPDVESLQDAESEDLRPWRAGSSTTIEGILRQIEDIASRRLEEPGPSVDVSSLLLNHPSPDGSTQPAPRTDESLLDPPPTTFDAALAQESDPPFMTDGRGRVVWSSTTSSRSRDGRRGRAASSASLLSHNKSGPDVLQSEDGCSTASRHDSPAQRTLGLPPRLVRQRSLPSVGGNSDIEEARPAEFVTDGRGRVVFAANNHDH